MEKSVQTKNWKMHKWLEKIHRKMLLKIIKLLVQIAKESIE